MNNQSRSREFDLDRFRHETGIDSDAETREIKVEFEKGRVTFSGTGVRNQKKLDPTSAK